MKPLRTLLAVVVITAAYVALSGCNTVKGIGTDIHDSAQHMQHMLEGGTSYQ